MKPSSTETTSVAGSQIAAPADADPIRWRILFVLLVTIFMTLVSVSIVNVALPSIRVGLGATESDLQWVLSGYALTFGVVLVAAGRAGDIMGRGGLFLIGVAIFTLSSVAAGLAPDAHSLNAARFVQGVGSGLLNPQGLGMIQHYFRGDARGKAFGYFGTTVGFSVAIGPVLGGLLIEFGGVDLGWRLTFLVNVPIGMLAIVLGLMWFPRPLILRLPRTGSGLRSLDPVGSLLLGLAVLAILFPFVESGGGAAVWLLLPAGLALVWLWVQWERRYVRLGLTPMVDLNIFSTRSYTNGITIMALYFMGVTSVWVLVALYVQEGDGKTALQSAAFGIPAALLSAYAAHWAGDRVGRLGRKLVIGGLLIALLGLTLSIGVVILFETGHVSIWWLMAPLALVGVAQGTVISPNQTLTLAEVPLDYAGSSGAIMQTGQRIGTAVGIALITAAVFATLAATSWAVAMVVGFGLIACVVVLALLVAIKDQRERMQQR
ncbi:MFS transporter [Roseovarius sp. SCSIO 43702]|uniref:MFS transporter n=1 Tax=Roseovarius sp. SCSIO 43702 TaxID=2823043 RepID=UPI001C73DC94|nr:MFS transporter [Roseovarius sp. SCSIO 43702]QYX57145.1 MFS transporter [Roseovarius sp. SCSIO 43702]